jgi:rubrerythrin
MKNGDRQQHMNRTGAALSPELTAELLEGARQTQPSAEGDGQEIARVRIEYAKEVEPTGSIPPPVTGAGAGKSPVKAANGKKTLVLADKLGERMAFERSGTRLYDAILSKHAAYGSWAGGPSREDLQEIRAEEHAHFTLLKQSIEQMGADPTAVTPSANLHAVASRGLCAVITDARTNLRESLEAILVAELVDNDGWENLIDLARALGHEDLAVAFTEALTQEREHLRRVRLWLGAAVSTEATGKLAEPFVARAEERDRRQLVATGAIDDQVSGPGQRRPEVGRRPARPRPAMKPERGQARKAASVPGGNGRAKRKGSTSTRAETRGARSKAR